MTVSYPILNFEYQGGTTLERFATHTDRGKYNTHEEAYNVADRSTDSNATGYCD